MQQSKAISELGLIRVTYRAAATRGRDVCVLWAVSRSSPWFMMIIKAVLYQQESPTNQRRMA